MEQPLALTHKVALSILSALHILGKVSVDPP
jgi:hypothetical protein